MMSSRADVTIGLSGQLVHKEVHLCSSPCLQCFLKTTCVQSLVIDIFLHFFDPIIIELYVIHT